MHPPNRSLATSVNTRTSSALLRHWRRRPVRLIYRSILLMGTCSFTAGSHPGSVGALSGALSGGAASAN